LSIFARNLFQIAKLILWKHFEHVKTTITRLLAL